MKTFAELNNLTVTLNNYLKSKQSKKTIALHVVGASNRVEISIYHVDFGLLSQCIPLNNEEAYQHLYQLLVMTFD